MKCWPRIIQIRNEQLYTHIRSILIIPLTRTQSSGLCRQKSYFCMFRDVKLPEIPQLPFVPEGLGKWDKTPKSRNSKFDVFLFGP